MPALYPPSAPDGMGEHSKTEERMNVSPYAARTKAKGKRGRILPFQSKRLQREIFGQSERRSSASSSPSDLGVRPKLEPPCRIEDFGFGMRAGAINARFGQNGLLRSRC